MVSISNIILSFCGKCGSFTEEGLGSKNDPECPNCGSILTSKESRIEGAFRSTEAERLKKIFSGYKGT